KEKYNQDLDLTKNRDVVFNSSFFQVQSALGSAAQTAGSRIAGSDTSTPGLGTSGIIAPSGTSGAAGTSGSSSSGLGTSGTSGTSGAGAGASAGTSGLGSSAGLASAANSMQSITVTIPASHGMPEARVPMTREAGQWVIQLPAGTDAQQLTQNIQQQLTQCD